MKVRIKTPPREREMDGINLDHLEPGAIRDVSPAIAAWLIVKGYAEPEMRRRRDAEGMAADEFPKDLERRSR